MVLLTDEWVILLHRPHHGWRQAGRLAEKADCRISIVATATIYASTTTTCIIVTTKAMHACDGGLQPAYAASYAAAAV